MKKEVYVILDNVRSLHNVGSIFRTSDAAGIKKIFLCGQTGYPPRTEITKTAIGAEEYVDWSYYLKTTDCIQALKKKGVKIMALEQTEKSIDYQELKTNEPVALVLGNEINGVSKEVLDLCDFFVEIPMRGKKDSLNVSVAFGIMAYQLMV